MRMRSKRKSFEFSKPDFKFVSSNRVRLFSTSDAPKSVLFNSEFHLFIIKLKKTKLFIIFARHGFLEVGIQRFTVGCYNLRTIMRI